MSLGSATTYSQVAASSRIDYKRIDYKCVSLEAQVFTVEKDGILASHLV